MTQTTDPASVARLHILNAMIKVIERRRELLLLLNGSREESARAVAAHFGLDEFQTQAVMDLQLFRLTDEWLSRLVGERDERAAQLPT